MTRKTKTAAAAIAAAACVAAIAITTTGSGPAPAQQTAAPKIFGQTRSAPRARQTDDAPRQMRVVARRFGIAWTSAASCGDRRSITAALELATGELEQVLRSSPPRPTAGMRCVRHPRVVSVLLVPEGQRTRAIVERPGEAGGDSHLQLLLQPTSAGPRVAAIDY